MFLLLSSSPTLFIAKRKIYYFSRIFLFGISTDVDELSKESSDVFFWCLKQNQECYEQWVRTVRSFAYIFFFRILSWCKNIDLYFCMKHVKQESIYLENLKASVALLRRLSSERKAHHELKLLKETFKRFREKVKYSWHQYDIFFYSSNWNRNASIVYKYFFRYKYDCYQAACDFGLMSQTRKDNFC